MFQDQVCRGPFKLMQNFQLEGLLRIVFQKKRYIKSTSNFQSLFPWLLAEKTAAITFTNFEDERSWVLFFHENLFIKSYQSDNNTLLFYQIEP